MLDVDTALDVDRTIEVLEVLGVLEGLVYALVEISMKLDAGTRKLKDVWTSCAARTTTGIGVRAIVVDPAL